MYGVALIGVAAGLPFGLMGLYMMLKYRWLARRGIAGPPPSEEPLDVVDRAVAGPALSAETGPAEPAVAVPGGVSTSGHGVVEHDGVGRRVLSRSAEDRLVIKGVHRSFGGVRAIDGVDLTVEQGRIHALVGPNGSGKTTLLNLICGFYRVDAGEIWMGETQLDGLRAAQVARLGIARTFQTPKLLIGDTALGNVIVGADRCAEGSLVGSVLHTRKSRAADRLGAAQATQALHEVGLPAGRSGWPRSCPTAPSGCSRSPGPWPCSPPSCCSTSRPPACRSEKSNCSRTRSAR